MPQAEITARPFQTTFRYGPYTSIGAAVWEAEGDHIWMWVSDAALLAPSKVEDYLMLKGWFRESHDPYTHTVRMEQMTFDQWLAFYPDGYRQYLELVKTAWNETWPKRCVCPENNCNGDGSTGRIVSQPFPNTSLPEHCPCDGHAEYLPDHPVGAVWEF